MSFDFNLGTGNARELVLMRAEHDSESLAEGLPKRNLDAQIEHLQMRRWLAHAWFQLARRVGSGFDFQVTRCHFTHLTLASSGDLLLKSFLNVYSMDAPIFGVSPRRIWSYLIS